MAKKNSWDPILAALAIGGFIWAIHENQKAQTLQLQLKQKETDYLNLLSAYLNQRTTLPEEIKKQLIHLRERYSGLEDSVSIELKSIIELIEIDKEEIAIEKLTKVIEYILKEKYVSEGKADHKSKCPKLFKMLESALEFKWISKHEFNFSQLLRDNRNEEAHELAVQFPTNWKYIAFLAGIELLYNLKGLKRNINE
jgi:hypothetical protein